MIRRERGRGLKGVDNLPPGPFEGRLVELMESKVQDVGFVNGRSAVPHCFVDMCGPDADRLVLAEAREVYAEVDTRAEGFVYRTELASLEEDNASVLF